MAGYACRIAHFSVRHSMQALAPGSCMVLCYRGRLCCAMEGGSLMLWRIVVWYYKGSLYHAIEGSCVVTQEDIVLYNGRRLYHAKGGACIMFRGKLWFAMVTGYVVL